MHCPCTPSKRAVLPASPSPTTFNTPQLVQWCRLVAGGLSASALFFVDEATRVYEKRSWSEEVLLALLASIFLVRSSDTRERDMKLEPAGPLSGWGRSLERPLHPHGKLGCLPIYILHRRVKALTCSLPWTCHSKGICTPLSTHAKHSS
jgi:hypothetical protein